VSLWQQTQHLGLELGQDLGRGVRPGEGEGGTLAANQQLSAATILSLSPKKVVGSGFSIECGGKIFFTRSGQPKMFVNWMAWVSSSAEDSSQLLLFDPPPPPLVTLGDQFPVFR
jgi:hypothetical protein